MGLEHVQVVLSHPSEPRNVGAACRALKNAGLTRLVVVTDSELDFDAARPLAVDASDVLDSAEVVHDLGDAVSASALVAGVTRRTGQRRKLVSFSPWQLAAKTVATRPGSVSVVFGNEQSGLSDAELELCHMAVGIPSSPALPSLNLSHAVQIIAYELYLADLQQSGIGAGHPAQPRHIARTGHTPIDSDSLDRHVGGIIEALEDLGFHTQKGPQGMPAFLHDILGRAMMSEPEAKRLRSLFEKLRGMHGLTD